MKVIQLAKNIIKANLNVKNFPFKLNFAITWKCNLKCKTCNIWMKNSLKELKLNEIEEFVKKNPYFSWVSLTGGEPFMRTDFWEIVELFKKYSPLSILNIPTNGTLTEKVEKDVRQILKLKIPYVVVTISLDGDRKTNDCIRGINGAFDMAISTFKILREISKRNKRLKLLFAYTISPFNVGRFEEAYDEVKKEIEDVSIYDFHINIFHYSTHYYSNDNISIGSFRNYKKLLLREIGKILKMKNNLNDPLSFIEAEYLKFATKFINTEKVPLPCKSLLTSIFLDPEGNMYPCTIWNVRLGNIRNSDYQLKKILTKEKTEKFLSVINNKRCPNCWTPCEANQTILGNLKNLF